MENEKGPQVLEHLTDRSKNNLVPILPQRINNLESIMGPESLNAFYTNFFTYFKQCGGCTGLRDQRKCSWSILCLHIETLARGGEIKRVQSLLPDYDDSDDAPDTLAAESYSSAGMDRYHAGPCTAELLAWIRAGTRTPGDDRHGLHGI
jgi:hypothetical protein